MSRLLGLDVHDFQNLTSTWPNLWSNSDAYWSDVGARRLIAAAGLSLACCSGSRKYNMPYMHMLRANASGDRSGNCNAASLVARPNHASVALNKSQSGGLHHRTSSQALCSLHRPYLSETVLPRARQKAPRPWRPPCHHGMYDAHYRDRRDLTTDIDAMTPASNALLQIIDIFRC